MEKYSATTEKTTININLIRIEVKDDTMSSTDFTKLFKKRNVSYAAHLTSFLIKRNVLIKFETGEYGFADVNKPVHVKMVDDFVKQARAAQKQYTEKYMSKEKEVEIVTKDGFKIKGIEHTNYRVVTVSGQFAIIDENNNIIKVF